MASNKRTSLLALVVFVAVSACSSSSGDVQAYTEEEPPGTAFEAGATSSSSMPVREARGSPAATHSQVQGSLDHLPSDGVGGAAPSSGNIVDVDFWNGFRYPASFDPEKVVEVTNGEYSALAPQSSPTKLPTRTS